MKMRLQTKMLLFILIPAIVGQLLVAAVSYRVSQETLREQVWQDGAALLQSQRVALAAVIKGLRGGLEALGSNPSSARLPGRLRQPGARSYARRTF